MCLFFQKHRRIDEERDSALESETDSFDDPVNLGYEESAENNFSFPSGYSMIESPLSPSKAHAFNLSVSEYLPHMKSKNFQGLQKPNTLEKSSQSFLKNWGYTSYKDHHSSDDQLFKPNLSDFDQQFSDNERTKDILKSPSIIARNRLLKGDNSDIYDIKQIRDNIAIRNRLENKISELSQRNKPKTESDQAISSSKDKYSVTSGNVSPLNPIGIHEDISIDIKKDPKNIVTRCGTNDFQIDRESTV